MVTKARTVARQWKNISQVLQKPDQAKVFLNLNYIFPMDFLHLEVGLFDWGLSTYF